MRFSILAKLFLTIAGVMAQSTATTTMTQGSTQTVTVLRVVSTTTSTYGTANSTAPYPTGTGVSYGSTGMPKLVSTTTSASVSARTSTYVGAAARSDMTGYGAAGLIGVIVAVML